MRPGRRLRDEEVVAAVVKAVLEHGHIVGQERLRAAVLEELRARRTKVSLGPERARRLAARSGMVDVGVETRIVGHTPELTKCPVCGSGLRRSVNATLTGAKVSTGYRCARCPWWTGAREYRVPRRYTFTAALERRGPQTRFKRKERAL